MEQLTKYMQDLIDEDLAKGTLTTRQIARRYGVDPKYVEQRLRVQNNTPSNSKLSEDGWGREELRKYAIARKHVEEAEWPITDEIVQAKIDYDEGRVEICTGRDGEYFILYRIPRSEVDEKREPYFSRIFGDP